jgi:hypothetical protein
MLGDPVKRLEFIAKKIPSFTDPATGEPNAEYWAIFETVLAMLLATGRDDLARRLEREAHRGPPSLAAIFGELRNAGITDTPFDSLIPWFHREMRRANAPIDDLKRLSAAIMQWQKATRSDLGPLRAADVFAALDAWETARVAEQRARLAYAFPDGWTVQKLLTDKELEEEGKVMRHCVGGYCEQVKAGESIIYSLRDPENQPHVTMEFKPEEERFTQVFGPENTEPDPVLRPYLVEFIQQVHGGEPMGLLLSGVPLREIDFRGAHLPGAHFPRADLSGADLIEANLYGANLNRANLNRADVSGADLSHADLSRAKLIGAKLIGAKLIRAYLYRADLSGAKLRDAKLRDAYLVGADLSDAKLPDAYLVGADLSGANLRDAYLYGANLSGANLHGVTFTPDTNFANVKINAKTRMDDDLAAILRPSGLGYYRRR